MACVAIAMAVILNVVLDWFIIIQKLRKKQSLPLSLGSGNNSIIIVF